MSLDDLAINKALKPVQAELDRQREKCAAMKKERDACAASQKEMAIERTAIFLALPATTNGDADLPGQVRGIVAELDELRAELAAVESLLRAELASLRNSLAEASARAHCGEPHK